MVVKPNYFLKKRQQVLQSFYINFKALKENR